MDKHLYLVMIADIIGSKMISDRHSVQSKLEKVLEKINRKYKHAIASQFIITLGDEFQGVLRDVSVAVQIANTVQREMYPAALRFGMGLGTISLPLRKESSLGSDGKAFHLARKMIEEVKSLESKKAGSKARILIGIENHENTSRLLNSILRLIWVVQASWTERQREVIAILEEYNETQAVIAKRMGIVQSSVQKSLASSQYYACKEATETIEQALKSISNESF